MSLGSWLLIFSICEVFTLPEAHFGVPETFAYETVLTA